MFLCRLGALGKSPKDYLKVAASDPNRRGIRCHLPLNLLPREVTTKRSKIIYVARNPKDAAVSGSHHYKNLFQYPGSLEAFLDDYYLSGEKMYGSSFQHAKEYLRLAKLKPENMFVITFEDLVGNMKEVIPKVAQFIGVDVTEAQVDHMTQYLSFEEMKKRSNSNMQDVVEMLMHGQDNGFE